MPRNHSDLTTAWRVVLPRQTKQVTGPNGSNERVTGQVGSRKSPRVNQAISLHHPLVRKPIVQQQLQRSAPDRLRLGTLAVYAIHFHCDSIGATWSTTHIYGHWQRDQVQIIDL